MISLVQLRFRNCIIMIGVLVTIIMGTLLFCKAYLVIKEYKQEVERHYDSLFNW